MTAQLLEYTTPADVRARRVRAARAAALGAADARNPAQANPAARWSTQHARACEVSRPDGAVAPAAPAAPARTRQVWTPRGVAVMVVLVTLVVGVMLATLVGAFLAVSNESAVAMGVPLAAIAAPELPGR